MHRPLTLLTAVCRGGYGFPFAVMMSEKATADDYAHFLDVIAVEIENQMPGENPIWDPIYL